MQDFKRDMETFDLTPHRAALDKVFGEETVSHLCSRVPFCRGEVARVIFFDDNKLLVELPADADTQMVVHEFAHALSCHWWPEDMHRMPATYAEAMAHIAEGMFLTELSYDEWNWSDQADYIRRAGLVRSPGRIDDAPET